MKTKIIFTMLGVLLYAGGLVQATTWTTLDYPGASATYLTGISGSKIVGYANSHGIIYDTTTQNWTTLDMQGAQSTEIDGIDGNNYVGKYRDASGYHGFLYDGTNWITFDVPGDRLNIAGISGQTIAGDYRKYNNTQPFLYNGTLTDITLPVSNSHIDGIDGKNLVGYSLYDGWHGFLYDGATSSIIDVPGMLATYPMDIDGENIVGYFQVHDLYKSFLYNGTTYTTIEIPEMTRTLVTSIDGTNLAGYYMDASFNTHGFSLVIPEPATMAFLLIGILGLKKVGR